MLHGSKPHITSIVIYNFWEKVYYRHIGSKFPCNSTEKLGRFVGASDTIGHALTYKILSDENKIVFRSRIRSAENPRIKNRILESSPQHEFIKSKINRIGELPTISPDDLIGRTFFTRSNTRWHKITCKNCRKDSI